MNVKKGCLLPRSRWDDAAAYASLVAREVLAEA